MQIGQHLHLSQHTVKSQAMSIYRKLGVSSRSQPVQRTQELGLRIREALPVLFTRLLDMHEREKQEESDLRWLMTHGDEMVAKVERRSPT